MPVVEPNMVEEKKTKEESTAVNKKKKEKKRKRESEEGKRKPKSNVQDCLEREKAGAMIREEDQETAMRIAKKQKVGKGKLGGDNRFDGDVGSVGEEMVHGMKAELDQRRRKKKKKKMKKDAIELEEQGDGGLVMGEEKSGSVCESEDKIKSDKKKRNKKKKKADKDAMELEEDAIELEEKGDEGFVIGEENGGSVCESEDKTKSDKEKRKKKKKKSDKDAMEFEEPDNVDTGQADDRVFCESDKCSVTLGGDKQVDMSKGEDKKRKGKKKRKESASVAQDLGQNTLAAEDVNSGNKERRKSKDKNEPGKMGKKKVSQRKDKGKQVSFSDSVEVLGDGVDDEEGGERSESGLVHGKRFTREEDAKLMETLINYAEMKQLGEKGLEIIRASKKNPELRGCWAEIAKALPHRPPVAVYKRARILLYRSTARKWTEEEYEIIRRFVEENGPNWVKLAAELGKSDIHVKDTWRRIKLKSYRKGAWTQDEYQNLFDLVNLDLRVKAHQKIDHGHRNIRENISWGAISDKITTRSNKDCCLKWYQQLASSLVKQGVWADTDDYLLVEALQKVDAVCLEDVDWDNLLDHRSGELCRQRWNQMVRLLGGHRETSFIEQVEVLSRRYSLEMIDYRK